LEKDFDVTQLDLVGKLLIVFGASSGQDSWIDSELLVPLVGGAGARLQLRDAALALEAAEILETSVVRGRLHYRRSELGAQLAEEALADLSSSLLAEAADANPQSRHESGAPESLDQFIGQDAARRIIITNLAWSRRTGRLPRSMLLYGRSGMGKSLLARLVASETARPFVRLSTPELTLTDLKDVAAFASEEGAVTLLDELQSATKRVRDQLLVELDPAMSRPWVAIGATTDPGAIPLPLRRRFELDVPLSEYAFSEAEAIAHGRVHALGLDVSHDLIELVGRAGRCNPARIRQYITEVQLLAEGTGRQLTAADFAGYLESTGRDARGVDPVELEMLLFLRDQCQGAAGMGKFVDTLGLDIGLVRERLTMLRREGLVVSRGRAGHALTTDGARYLAARRL
jgi:Holliday junction resolvasome RuvABC ATP-dependent DNA helicase subunit